MPDRAARPKEASMNSPITFRLPEIVLTDAEILANLVYPADPPTPVEPRTGEGR
jgi:hypothetical protein